MKSRTNKLIIITIFGIGLMISQITACDAGNRLKSTPTILASGISSALVETNDVIQMQKEIPFTMILPGYLPDELKSSNPKFTRHVDNNNQNIFTIYKKIREYPFSLL